MGQYDRQTVWFRCRWHPSNVAAASVAAGLDPPLGLCHRYDEVKDAPCLEQMERFVPTDDVRTD